jgi:hypothetical protein
MGEAGLNIATLNLGRDKPGGEAICMVAIDEPCRTRCWPRCAPWPQVGTGEPVVFRAFYPRRRLAVGGAGAGIDTIRHAPFRHICPLPAWL